MTSTLVSRLHRQVNSSPVINHVNLPLRHHSFTHARTPDNLVAAASLRSDVRRFLRIFIEDDAAQIRTDAASHG